MSMDEGYAGVKAVVERFKTLSRTERQHFNEQNTRKDFILPLFRALEWDVYNSAEVSAEDKVSRGWVDFAFRLGGVPRFFLETKAIKEDLTKAEWVKQAIDYAWTKSVTWAVLSDFEGLRVFNAEWKEDDPERARFIEFGVDDYLPRFEQLWWLSRSETAAGRLDREAEKWGKKVKREPVSQHLFDDLRDWRSKLFNTLRQYNKQWSPAQIDEAVLVLLNRMIFMRAAEDREVEPRRLQPLLREVRRQDLLPELRKLFRYFDATYNSQLFATHRADILDSESQPFETLIAGLYGRKSTLYNFNAIDADVLGTAYEQYLGHVVADPGAAEVVEKRTKRKSQGIYYTPSFVVKYIVQQTVGRRLREDGFNPSKPVRILDMACGSGSFLIEAFDVLDRFVAQQQGAAATEGAYDVQDHARQIQLLQTCIYGVDKDEQAVAVARLNLLLKALHVRDKLPMLANIRNGDSLISGAADELKAAFGPDWRSKKPFNWAEEFPEVMEQGGFDVIIGNPPYVRIQTLPKDEVSFFGRNYQAATGSYDIYVLFVERALQMLKPGGVLGFILPNKFMQVDYGVGIRKLLADNMYVDSIVDFKEFQVFEGATTYTCLLFLKKQQNYTFSVLPMDSHTEDHTVAIFDVQKHDVSANQLSGRAWLLSGDRKQTLLTRLSSESCVRLLDLPVQISRGSSSGADTIFILEASDKGTLRTKDGKVVEIEPALLKKPLYATDFGHYIFRPRDTDRIIFPYMLQDDGYQLLNEDVLATTYPDAYAYLSANRKHLEERKDFKTWYAFSAPRSLNTHVKAHIVVPLLADRGLYAMLPDTKNDYCLMASGGFSLLVAAEGVSPKYVLGLLNSTLLYWNLRQTSNVFRGGWITCTKQYVGELPIRLINFSDPADRARHDQMVAMVDEMLALQKGYAAAERNKEDNRHALKGKIDRLDAAIDNLVYELYGLTEEEIAVVESSR